MPAEIWLGPVGAGKTAFALDQLAQTLTEQPFARVWVLVSGRRQEDAFRQRLVEQGRRVYFNVEFFTFYQLYHRLLNIAQQPPRRLDDAARYGLLRAILAGQKAQGRLRVFEAIAETPGFVRIMAEFIYELKQNLIPPETFAQAAQTRKDAEIAAIYAEYQNRLREHNLVDREGEGWLALDVMEKQPHIGRNVDLLLVDGYDQFTPLQASLLMLVAARARRALVTLATVPGREDTIGRRFAEARTQLEIHSPSPPAVRVLAAADEPDRSPELRHMADHIFRRDGVTQPASGHVVFIEAPAPAQEAAAVLRRVKRLLLAGAQPDDVVIALRDWPRYGGHFATLGQVYGVPLALHRGESLQQNPAVMSLLNLLNLHETDFRRRNLLDVLRSPYFAVPGIGVTQVEQLELISQQLIVTGGRENWLEAIRRAGRPLTAGDEDDETSAAPLLDAESAAQLHLHLDHFFRRVTPPPHAPLAAYVNWLRDLIGPDVADPDDDAPDEPPPYTLNLPAQIRKGEAPGVADRDLTALDEFMRVLRSLLSAESLLDVLNASREMNRELFLLELRTAVHNTAINRGPVRTGRVLVTTVTDARGLPHNHVFIPGLSEGIFPAPLSEDPLYLDSERAALRERGITLETQAERAADDGLFYQLIGIARQSLTLSRPTVQDGVPWPPSHLWRAVASIISDADAIIQAHQVRVGQVVRASEAAAPGELLLALADGLSRQTLPDDLPGYYAWMMAAYGAAWQRVDHARMMELRRLSRRVRHDHYAGRLRDAGLIAHVAALLGPGRLWSATQLNDYGLCAFRFFAKRLLRLEALEEPEEGLDAPKRGTINHAVLEKTYAAIGARGLAIAPENLDTALAILRSVAGPVLDAAPAELGFPDNALWRQERVRMLRQLESLVRLDFSEKSPVGKLGAGERRPYRQEAPFGTEDGPPVVIPVEVDGRPEMLRVRGFIDRVDLTDAGVVVVDYKGSTKIPKDDMRIGRNFQMTVYLHAIQQMLAAEYGDAAPQVRGGLFWHLNDLKSSSTTGMDEAGLADLEQSRLHIGRHIAAGRRGDFAVRAAKDDEGKCIRYCEFAQLCRAAGTSRYKPEDDAS
jgi:ATP-dependent helicase/nuclease subunit B